MEFVVLLKKWDTTPATSVFHLIGIFYTYQGVVNAMQALSDKPIHYALSIPFVK